MPSFDAGEITTNGVSVPIQVDDYGNWTARFAGKYVSADTRDRLKGKLSRLTKATKVDVAVPVVLVKSGGPNGGAVTIRRGVLTGIHSSNGNVLVTWTIRGQEVKEQITGLGFNDLFVTGDVKDAELSELAEIRKELAALQDRHLKWSRAREISPKEAVQAAIDARLAAETGQ